MIFDFRFEWRQPYRWRTNLRSILPRPICWLIDKGPDCESAGAAHDWYNHDDETSHCYHCQVERPGELWRKDSIGAPFLPPPRH
jgi:hypothetical protein